MIASVLPWPFGLGDADLLEGRIARAAMDEIIVELGRSIQGVYFGLNMITSSPREW